jgi:hypothetical protein
MRDNSAALMCGYAPEMSFRLNLTADLSPGPYFPMSGPPYTRREIPWTRLDPPRPANAALRSHSKCAVLAFFASREGAIGRHL